MLRPDKRTRPLILRVAAGDCLDVTLTNLLAPVGESATTRCPASVPPFNILVDEQVADRTVGFHVTGMQLRTGIADDSSMVGRVVTDPGSMVPVGQSKVYRLFAEKEGVFLAQSLGGPFGSEGSQGNSANGLFGQVIVEPKAREDLSRRGDRGRDAPRHRRHDRRRPADHQLRGDLSERRAVDPRRQGEPAGAQHDQRHGDRAFGDRRRHRRPQRRRQLPALDLSAGERRQA